MELSVFVTSTIESLGYLGIGALTLLEVVVPPIPSELVLPFAGFSASQGSLTLWGVILVATVGALIGASILYGLARLLSLKKLRGLAGRYGRYLRVKPSDLDRSAEWFQRHGPQSVFFGRMIPGLRSLISLPAGVSKMRFWQFVLWTGLGTAIWSATLTLAGYLLGRHYELVGEYLGPVSWIVLGSLILAGIWHLSKRNSQ